MSMPDLTKSVAYSPCGCSMGSDAGERVSPRASAAPLPIAGRFITTKPDRCSNRDFAFAPLSKRDFPPRLRTKLHGGRLLGLPRTCLSLRDGGRIATSRATLDAMKEAIRGRATVH
jgi:hypothetical protein